MSIDKTIEQINAIPDNWLLFIAHDDGTETRPFITTDDLKALTAYTERLETALRHYASTARWFCCSPSYLHDCADDNDRCWFTLYEDDGEGWEVAQEALKDRG